MVIRNKAFDWAFIGCVCLFGSIFFVLAMPVLLALFLAGLVFLTVYTVIVFILAALVTALNFIRGKIC